MSPQNPKTIDDFETSTQRLIPQTSTRKRIFDDSDDEEEEPCESKETDDMISDTCSLSASTCSTPSLKSKKIKIIKTEDDNTPLPDPFPLPKPDVEKALKEGCISKTCRSHFLSSVASLILAYKKYPTREDYVCVAHSIIKNYPFLKAPPGAGSPYVSWIYSVCKVKYIYCSHL